jgi:hypothetical protein
MEDLEEFFNAVTEDGQSFKDVSMFFLTMFVNRNLLKIHWDISTQSFAFTVNELQEQEDDEEEDLMEVDPDDILRRMLNRKKRK